MLRAAALLAAAAAAHGGPIVDTQYGKVEGHVDKSTGTEFFWGIPYAAPPVGNNRFAPPTAAEKWEGVKRLDEFIQPPECPQVHIYRDIMFGKEDCLTLDVYRPANATAGAGLGVMVWIYGGGFVSGSEDASNSYNGKNLALKYNRIVVAMNYRLGNLGFIALEALMNEHGTTGNYGLLDQQFAMKWVQTNIHSFGGNPANVVLFGESAGAISVTAHMAIPSSRGLFRAAIAESSVPVSDISFAPYKNSTAFGEVYADKVGCPAGPNQLSCLRGLSIGEVMSPLLEWRRLFPKDDVGIMPRLMPVMPYFPVIDGVTLPKTPLEAAEAGECADVPFVIGTNHDEGTSFSPIIPLVVNGDFPAFFDQNGWERTLRHFFNETVAESVDKFYTAMNFPTIEIRVQHLITDFIFACPTRYLLRALNSNTKRTSPVFMYQFNQTLNTPSYNVSGDAHSLEIPYVWYLPASYWLPDDYALSGKMSSYWASMTTASAPACDGCNGLQWPPYHDNSVGNDSYMSFMTPTGMKNNFKKDICDFWDNWGYINNP
eukprot:TRINITY_DN46869_c0_g1_i1.p1 TRINITY_DN46869_c0_g1~~TRINITY_DN46869_c0_g1_i1.p1  ORF type:complete len:543 (+),score=188.36 TRINITY_DN46869_c0_g1_i1:45-1673(+)